MFASNDTQQLIDILICNDLKFNPETMEDTIKAYWKDCKDDLDAKNGNIIIGTQFL